MAIVGAGYVAVEISGILRELGVEVHMFIRGETFLRSHDPIIGETMTGHYEDIGIKIHRGFKGFEKIENLAKEGEDKNLKLTWDGGEMEVGECLWAVGRKPETESLGLEAAGIKLGEKGHIVVDEFQNTSTAGVYALGDVTGQKELTPGTSSPLLSQ